MIAGPHIHPLDCAVLFGAKKVGISATPEIRLSDGVLMGFVGFDLSLLTKFYCAVQVGLSASAPQFVPKSAKATTETPLPELFSDLDIGTIVCVPSVVVKDTDTPDSASTLQSKLLVAAGRGDAEAAGEAFTELEQLGVTPDPATFNGMIHANSRDPAEAKRWLGRMQLAGWAPNTATYSLLVQACAKAGAMEEAEEWFREMESASLVGCAQTIPRKSVCTRLISVLMPSGRR